MGFKRRQVLFGGVAAGVGATVSTEYATRRAAEQRNAELLKLAAASDPTEYLKQTFAADAQKVNAGLEIQASVPPVQPTIAYSREMSKVLIQCSKLATQQYITGKTIGTYDGAIKTLPAYSPALDGYTQLIAFKGKDVEVEESIEVNLPTTPQSTAQHPLEQQASDAEAAIGRTVKEVVKIHQLTPVYLGFVLASKAHNIIVFRGTQRNTEWIYNIYAQQREYYHSVTGESLGKVHRGFVAYYMSIHSPTPKEIAQQLDPSIPCYITGHSLGSALAVLTSVELGLTIPALKSQIQLYSYAGARVGDPAFAGMHTQLVPNHYRVVNLVDAVPMLPPIQSPMDGHYVHTGQEWSFLTQKGDFLPNHVVDTYYEAIAQGAETNRPRTYPMSI
jgi:triacylglycerol lipase